MKPNLEEIELALKDRQWLTLDASVLLAWLIYTRELEGNNKPTIATAGECHTFNWGPGVIFKIK